jgi:hypothetical protein
MFVVDSSSDPESGSESDSNSDCGAESDTGSDSDSYDNSNTDVIETTRADDVPFDQTFFGKSSVDLEKNTEGTQRIWIQVPLPKILSYMSHGTTCADYSFPSTTPETSDFALIDPQDLQIPTLSNDYKAPGRDTTEVVSDHLPTKDLVDGGVLIITSCDQAPIKGYLLGEDASVIIAGTTMHTKRVQTEQMDGTLYNDVHKLN